MYSFEGSQTTSYGRVTFDPKENTTKVDLNASQYVLWPNQTYKSTDASTNAYKPVATGKTTDPTYSIKKLGNSGDLTTALGWKDGHGNALSYNNLNKVFSLGNGISNVTVYYVNGADISLNNSGYVRAPIGSTGEESYIPTGCVAFRVNTTAEAGNPHKIRVIVAVPRAKGYSGEVDALGNSMNTIDYNNDYYFCLWNVTPAGSQQQTTINLNTCIQAFELPRSAPYYPGASVASAEYINVTYQNQNYHCYLNGDEVLVAYEFEVVDEGIYFLGSTKESRIVYFSADGTAMEGEDGETSYKMGSIDFVYDNGSNKILTVKDGYTGTTAQTTKDYANYYYHSFVLLSTNNDAELLTGDTDVYSGTYEGQNYSYPNVNDFAIYVQRTENGTGAEMTMQVKGGTQLTDGIADAAYIELMRYHLDADTVSRDADALKN